MNIKRLYSVFALSISALTLFALPVKGKVKCSDNNENIGYASIYLQKQLLGTTADSLGNFQIPDEILNYQNDTLVFSSVGYKKNKIAVKDFEINDGIIYLNKAIILLNEIVVNKTTNIKSKNYGFYKMSSSMLGLNGNPGSRICTFIKNDNETIRQIQSLQIKIRKKNVKNNVKLRIFFYSKTANGFEKNNLLKNDIIISDFSKNTITVDLTNEDIIFPKEGIYIGIEWLMSGDKLIDYSKKTELSVLCTNKVKENNTWILKNGAWELFPDKKELEGLPKFIKRKVENANAQIGILAL